MADQIQYDTRVKDASEVINFLFDFSWAPELKPTTEGGSGETLDSVEIDAVVGLTIGSPSVTAADVDGIPAGRAATVTISGGTATNTYSLEMRGTTSGGSVRVVKGSLVVE